MSFTTLRYRWPSWAQWGNSYLRLWPLAGRNQPLHYQWLVFLPRLLNNSFPKYLFLTPWLLPCPEQKHVCESKRFTGLLGTQHSGLSTQKVSSFAFNQNGRCQRRTSRGKGRICGGHVGGRGGGRGRPRGGWEEEEEDHIWHMKVVNTSWSCHEPRIPWFHMKRKKSCLQQSAALILFCVVCVLRICGFP